MNDPHRPARPPYGTTGAPSGDNYATADPAYADQTVWAPNRSSADPWPESQQWPESRQWSGSQPSGGSGFDNPWSTTSWPSTPPSADPTRQLPPAWPRDTSIPEWPAVDDDAEPEPTRATGPRAPRWLWIVAAVSVVLVVAMGVALFLANERAKSSEIAEPAIPATTRPVPSLTIVPPTLTLPRTTSPLLPPLPSPPVGGPARPAVPTTPGIPQPVVYTVAGEGRAISIMYMDSGDILQTEFNVALPWRKQVSLPKSTSQPASVTVVNIGFTVTCSVSVAGNQVSQRTGAGLTICQGMTY